MRGDSESSGICVNLAKVLLLLINMVFLVTGCLIVYFSHRVKHSGWMEVFEDEFAWIGDSTFVFLLVVGAIAISLATLGCLGAWLRQRIVLLTYSIILLVTFILFAVVVYGASSAHGTAQEWNEKEYPADSQEEVLAANFNELFCYAQVPYYCTQAKVSDVLEMFELPLGGYFAPDQVNVSSVCTGSMKLPQVEELCRVCELVDKYSAFEPVWSWTEEKCPRNAENQRWCAQFLVSNNEEQENVFSDGAPYAQCRPAFYTLVLTWTNVAMIASIVACVVIILMFVFSCVIRRDARQAHKSQHEEISFYG